MSEPKHPNITCVSSSRTSVTDCFELVTSPKEFTLAAHFLVPDHKHAVFPSRWQSHAGAHLGVPGARVWDPDKQHTARIAILEVDALRRLCGQAQVNKGQLELSAGLIQPPSGSID